MNRAEFQMLPPDARRELLQNGHAIFYCRRCCEPTLHKKQSSARATYTRKGQRWRCLNNECGNTIKVTRLI